MQEEANEKTINQYINQHWKDKHDPIFDHIFTYRELNSIMKSLPQKKSPGPPGLTYEFVNLLWHISPKALL